MSRYCTLLLALLALSACSSETPENIFVGVTASDRIELTAEAAEPVIEIAVAEGSRVAAGDLLVQQDPTRARANLATAEADVAQARARLAELVRGPREEQIRAGRANVSGARDQVRFRTDEFERISRIYEQDLLSTELRDQAKSRLDAAVSSLELYEAQLEEMLAGTTVEELDQAEAAVAAAEARVDTARLSLDRLSIRAPVDGLADSRLFEIGERPVAGQPVFVMLGGEQAYARVYVTEARRVSTTPGSKVRVHVDGIGTPLDGRVRWVSSDASFTPYYALTEHDRGRLSYVAKVDILGRAERIPDGVPVEVELLDDAR